MVIWTNRLRHEDLTAAGLTYDAIRGRLRSGRLTLLHRGAYALGHSALRDEGRLSAALWATEPDDVLSHTAAAAFYRWLRLADDEDVHLRRT